MTEIHAWLVIRATHLNEDNHPEINEKEIYDKVEGIISNLKYNEIKILQRNGLNNINMFLYTNHKTKEADELIETFTKIAEMATGSYGLLYYWNDEDNDSYDDYKVLIARKGVVEWKADDFFSPQSLKIYEE